MIDFVVSEVKREELVVGEQKLSNHHSTICFDFVMVKVQILQISAFFESLSQVLGTLTLDFVTLKVKTQKPWTLGNQVTKSLCSLICDFVVTQIYILDINGKLVKRRAECNEAIISDSIVEVHLIVSFDDNFKGFVVFHGVLQILHESIMGSNFNLVTLLLVEESNLPLV